MLPESHGTDCKSNPLKECLMSEYELIASKGCGSAVIEMALALAGLPHRVTLIPYWKDGPERSRLLSLNPLG